VCSRCKIANYCNVECQRKDWPGHKGSCKQPPSFSEIDKELAGILEKKQITYNDFEIIRKVGDGNFTQIFQVEWKRYSGLQRYYALKVCSMQ
jgi:hypothetical protein